MQSLNHLAARVAGKVPLRTVVIVPFVLQMVGTVGLVGYLSFKSGQKSVEELAHQLMDEVDERVEQNLQHYLNVPKQMNQSLAAGIRTRVLDWKNCSGLERYFAQQLQVYDTVSTVAIATEQKEFLAVEKALARDALIIRVLNQSTNYAFHYYAANPQGKRIKLTKVRHDFDPHNDPPKGRPWYQAAQEAGQAIWLPVVNLSQGVDHPILTMVNFLPFDDSDGKFQGVLAAAVYLPHFASFLSQLEIGQTGQVFIIDRQGLLIASSTGETPFKPNLDSDYLKNLNPQEWRVTTQNSINPLTQASVKFLLFQVKDLHQIKQKKNLKFDFHHNRHFLQVSPISIQSELDGLIITVVPEADFMKQIYANTRTTSLLCMAALVGATTIGILTARWITKPILRLNTAAKDIANGQWDKPVRIERVDEVGELASSFNRMAAQLQSSFAELQSLNQALAQRESQLRQFLDAIPVGVSIHEVTGKVLYFNQAAKHLLGIESIPNATNAELAQVYQLYRQKQLYPTEELPALRALEGETVFVDDIELHRDGEMIPCEIRSTPIFDEQGNIIYAIGAFSDITQRKQAEKLLAGYNQTLEAQVAERTAELASANEQLQMEIAERNLIEAKLYSSTEEIRKILDSITDFIAIIDDRRNIQIAPTKTIASDTYGPNLLNSIIEHFFQEDTKENWFAKVQQVVETQQIIDYEYSLSLNHQILWFTACISPLQDNSVLWVARDISDRKRAELALQDSQGRFAGILEIANDAIITVDASQRITLFNQGAEKIFGYTSDEILGQPLDLLLPTRVTEIHHQHVTGFTESVGKARRMGDRSEIFGRRKDGTEFPAEASISKLEINGQIACTAILRDISDRKLAEQSLIESEARFQAFMNYSPLLAWISDGDGTMLYCNRSAELWSERAASELIGETIFALHPPDIAQEHLENIRYVINTREVLETNESAFSSDGTLHDFLTYKFPLIDANGQCLVGGIAADITIRKRAEEALQESQARLQKLTNNVPGSIYGVVLHTDGSISFEYMSSAVRDIHEVEPEQVLENATLLFDQMHPDDRASYSVAVEISAQTLGLFQHEWRITTPSGKLKWLQATSKPERRSNGDIVWYGAVFDITDKKKFEESLQRYERIISATTDAMSLVDKNYIYQVVNQTYRIWHNKQYEEIIGHSVSEILGLEVFDSVIKEPLERCLDGETAHYQNWFELAIGRCFLSVTYSPYLEPDNTISGVVVSLRDLTKLQQAEEALRESEAQLNMIVTNTCDGIMILDEQSKIAFANPAAVELFNLPSEELIGYQWGMPLQETAEIELISSNGQIRIAEMKAVRTTWQGESAYVVVLRDITDRKLAEQALRENANRERAITQVLQRMRQSLDINTIFSTTTEELRSVIKCDRVAIYQFNPDWSGKFVAESVASGWRTLLLEQNNVPHLTDDILDGENCAVRAWGVINEPIQDTYLQAAQGGIYSQTDSYLASEDIYKTGLSPCHIELLEQFQAKAYLIVPIFCGNKLWGLLASYHNTSSCPWSKSEINTVVQIGIQLGVTLQQAQLLEETRQQSAALQKAAYAADAANRAKSNFLANMSHELRTPLNGIMGYAQILQGDKNCTPKQREGINIIYQCGTHLLTLINDILDLSKIEAQRLELYPEDIHLPTFLAEVYEIFQLKAVQKDIDFTYLPLNSLPVGINVDKKRLRQVLMNLLSNAVKFTDRGSVTFKVARIDHERQEQSPITKIRFQVEDTGIGISPEQLEKIFLPFEQVGDKSRRSEGTGLGLTISQRIVEMMGSQILVESTAGVGSTFWFDLSLPEILTSTRPINVKSTERIIGYSGSKRKILVVDDRWENCAVLSNILEPIGFELEQAANGQEGLEKAVEFQPDLIFVDLVMPAMDGFEMTRQLRQLPQLKHTVVIAISANAFAIDRRNSLESGCNDFLPKPVQAEELLKKIKDYLNLSWVYEQEGHPAKSTMNFAEMVIPTPDELFALYEAANSGDIEGVEQECMRLQDLSSDYISFVLRVLELAQAFEYEEIARLIDRYLSQDSQ
jgi:PAS domain S-box-containing protein